MEFFNSPSSNAAEKKKPQFRDNCYEILFAFQCKPSPVLHKTFLAVSSFRHIPCELKT